MISAILPMTGFEQVAHRVYLRVAARQIMWGVYCKAVRAYGRGK